MITKNKLFITFGITLNYNMKVFILLLIVTICSCRTLYNSYKVIRTDDLTEDKLEKIEDLLLNTNYDFWYKPRINRPLFIMTSEDYITDLWNQLHNLNLQPQIYSHNVQDLIDKERQEIEIKRQINKFERAPDLTRYLNYTEVMDYLNTVVQLYPNIASLENIDTTEENRSIVILKLSNGPGKSGLFFDAGVHAREWAAPPTLLYAINELTENLINNQAMLDANDFYFLPMGNPDGYVYTWEIDRFWRKNRNSNNGSVCKGVDPNRNWDYAWGGSNLSVTCDLFYPGVAPFSEAESRGIADYLLLNPSITFYTSIHSYGQYVLYPYGDTMELPPTYVELDRVAREAALIMEGVNGNEYLVGTTAQLLYFAYGQADDWVYDKAGVPFSYTIELPGGGIGGFDLPPEQILPVSREVWEAIKIFAANTPPPPSP